MDRAIESFVKYQNEADKKYQKWEEKRRKETELDEIRRKEEQEHEIQLFQMLAQVSKSSAYLSQQYSFEYEY